MCFLSPLVPISYYSPAYVSGGIHHAPGECQAVRAREGDGHTWHYTSISASIWSNKNVVKSNAGKEQRWPPVIRVRRRKNKKFILHIPNLILQSRVCCMCELCVSRNYSLWIFFFFLGKRRNLLKRHITLDAGALADPKAPHPRLSSDRKTRKTWHRVTFILSPTTLKV